MKMNNSILTIAILFCMSACNTTEQDSSDPTSRDQSTFMKENVALVDARVRSVSSTSFVKEIVLANFSTEDRLPVTVTFENLTFSDDGLRGDAKMADGIYTSDEEFKHSEALPFEKEGKVTSVLSEIVVDKTFKHRNRLAEFATVHAKEVANNSALDVTAESGPVATLTCDIDLIWGGCWGTCYGLKVSNCSFTIGWN